MHTCIHVLSVMHTGTHQIWICEFRHFIEVNEDYKIHPHMHEHTKSGMLTEVITCKYASINGMSKAQPIAQASN
jgi:hypothetical protein